MTDAETQLASFFAAYDPATAELGRAFRARLRARLPGLSEVVYVYDGQGALVISYSPTERGSDGVCSLAVRPGEVRLYFAQGARLVDADPARLLQGRGPGVRHIVLCSAEDLDRAPIERLMAAAVKLAKLRLDAGARGAVILRAEEQRRRARRSPKAARPPAKRRTARTRR